MRACFAFLALVATLVAQSTAQIPFAPVFPVSQYDTSEGNQLVVHLLAPILSNPGVPSLSGSVEVDIIVEDMPAGSGPRQNATLGSDYIVDTQAPQSNTFTVTFQSAGQSQSSEYAIQIVDDSILEGREHFRLRIIAVRFIGSLAEIFRVQDGVEGTLVDVSIEDNDTVQVRWNITEAMSVTEGEAVRLRAEVLGMYAIPIAIGVKAIATSVQPAIPGKDFNFAAGFKLHFTDVGTNQSFSVNQVEIPIIDDDIAEPRESFICNLQGDSVNSVQVIFPSQATIEIIDNDELIVRWAKDYYEFTEGDMVTEVELVTDSVIEVDHVSISGLPLQIPDGHVTRISSLVVPGPFIPGFTLDAAIERVQFRGLVIGNAQVTQAGRTDVQRSTSEFTFTPIIKSAFQNFTIVDDSVLEFDELFIAEFDFGPELLNNWKVRKGVPSITYCLIRDNDFVEVNFNEESYTVSESEGQVSLSLRITGKFFFPVHAIIEVSSGTATDPAGARRHNVTFRQTAYTDQGIPSAFALSHNISINITSDDIFKDVEYFQVRIVETSNSSHVKIVQPDTVNVTILQDKLPAIAVTPDTTVVGRVTQTLKLECTAKINSDDTNVNFTWKLGGDEVSRVTVLHPTNGMASAAFYITRLSVEKHHDQVFECHPNNAIGGENFTEFKLSVELFLPPEITKFALQPDRKDALGVEWLPVNVTGYPDASVGGYYIELARDKDGSVIEASATVTGGNVSHVFSVEECSENYWVRIKAVSDTQDVSSFSGWVPLEAVNCPIITVPGPKPDLPGWAIFLIIFFLLLLCLLCIFLLCCLLLCCKWNRDPKRVYNAEKREKLYRANKAYSVMQEEECETLERVH